MYIDDIKVFAKNEKEQEILTLTIRRFHHDRGTEFGIEKCSILIMKRVKKETREGM